MVNAKSKIENTRRRCSNFLTNGDARGELYSL